MPRRMAREPKPVIDTPATKLHQVPQPSPGTEPAPAAPAPVTKISTVLALLSRPDGATLAELVEATGWQPHTTRAALTGLKKKGHTIDRGKRGEMTFYRVVEAG